MSRDLRPGAPGPDERREPDPPPTPGPGHVRGTSAGTVVAFALTGLVLGWLVHPVSVSVTGTAPTVSWLPVAALAFVALVVGSLAWSTYRLLHRRHEHLLPHHAVNRLVMAKACALAGALVAGGYLGYALSWVGLTDAALARQRAVHALLAGLAGVLLVVGSLLLERACRVGRDDRGGPGRPGAR